MSCLRGNLRFTKNPKVQHNIYYIFSKRAFYSYLPESIEGNTSLRLWKAMNDLMVISGNLVPPEFILGTLLIR